MATAPLRKLAYFARFDLCEPFIEIVCVGANLRSCCRSMLPLTRSSASSEYGTLTDFC